MTVLAARRAGGDRGLLADYGDYCAELPIGLEPRQARLRGAAAFLAAFPNLDAWMQRPLEVRLRDLRRHDRAWGLLSYALLTGTLSPDFSLLVAKNVGPGFAPLLARLYPDDVARLAAAADRLDIKGRWARHVIDQTLPLVVAATGRRPTALTVADLDDVQRSLQASPLLPAPMRQESLARLHALRRLLFEAGITDEPAVRRRGPGPADPVARLSRVTAPEVRRSMLAYLATRSPVLRPATVAKLITNLANFGEFLSQRYPELTGLAQLQRAHVEAYCAWATTRPWRGSRSDRRIGPSAAVAAVISVRTFLSDIAAWGWADAPPRPVMFPADVPRPPRTLPRALPPDVDRAVMAAVADLEDPFPRLGLQILRGTGLRVGELLDLELECVVDYPGQGRWLRVPVGKLNTERSIPLGPETVAAINEWRQRRGPQRALPHPRDGRLTDFLFTIVGRRPGPRPLQGGLNQAVAATGRTGADGQPLHVVTHQLRHTYATALVNAGMPMQALMALLGHTSPQMTLRYATLAPPTLRAAYDNAVGKARPGLPLAQIGQPPVPDRVSWLSEELLKTRLAHGYCSRDLVAEACPYANICEACANFRTRAEFRPVLQAQLADVEQLHEDAKRRGWTSEAARHAAVITHLRAQVRRLDLAEPRPTTLTSHQGPVN